MVAPQIPNAAQEVVDQDGLATTFWYRFFQGIYKSIRADLPTKLSGILNINTTPVGNIGAGTDDLISYSLSANMLKNDGDYLEVEGWGIFAANSNNKTVTVNFGSQIIYTTDANAANDGTWSFKAKIVRLTSSTQEIVVEFLSNNTTLQDDPNYPVIRTAGTQNLTTILNIKCTGTGTSTNDIIQKMQIIKLSPND